MQKRGAKKINLQAVLIKNSDLHYVMPVVMHTSEFIPFSKFACVFIVTYMFAK